MPKKKYQPGDIVNLDDVVPSLAALAAWSEVARRAAEFCHMLRIPEKNLPEEQARLNADGSILIFVEIKTPSGGGVTFDMNVPASEFNPNRR